MTNKFFTSDLHFGHNKDFIYESRGFKSIQEHDEALVSLWNNVVSEKDEVYILGDLMLGDNEHGIEMISKLNGIKYYIGGNHDTPKRKSMYENAGIIFLGDAYVLKHKKWSFYLSHYPTITDNFDDSVVGPRRMTWNLYGHTHSKNKFEYVKKNCACYNVGIDAHMQPVNVDDIIHDLCYAYNVMNGE